MKTSYINGAFIPAGDRVLENKNPSDITDVVDRFSRAGRTEAEQAIEAATVSVPDWGTSNPQARFDALDFIGSEILRRREELGVLLSREEGKTLPEGIGEVTRAGYLFKFFAGEAVRTSGGWRHADRPRCQRKSAETRPRVHR